MILFRAIPELRQYIQDIRNSGKTLGFVPTMGALHAGHLSLIEQSRLENDVTLLSIFVNPTQFNESSDFTNYPRTEEKDLDLIRSLQIEVVFLPTTEEMYRSGVKDLLDFPLDGLDTVMEGKYREGHFEGVVTIVDKFFALIEPDKAYFGLKDFQQLAIIRYLAQKRYPAIQIVPCAIVREADGLAMSSRNVLLQPEERKKAVLISQVLFSIQEMWKSRTIAEIIEVSKRKFEHSGLDLEYLEIADSTNLQSLDDYSGKPAVACIAARIGKVRLIDNCELPA
jgi:pantoate--beta-alanine ligase